MQDSPVAPLQLKTIDRAMPSTWLATDAVGGDRLGECMCNGHTYEEVLELVQRMDESWREGNAILSKLENFENEDRIEQKSVAHATSLIFRSGYNIIRFYYLRRLLGIGKGDPCEIFQAMCAITEEEIEISKTLIPICEQDNGIGYHSEAHGHKIFTGKLKWRIKQLKELLATEFVEVEKRINAGLPPLPFYNGKEGNTVVYRVGEDKTLYLKNQNDEDGETFIELSEVDGGYNLIITKQNFSSNCIVIKPEFRMFHPLVPIYISKGEFIFPTSKTSFFTFANSYRTFFIHLDDIESELKKYKFKVEQIADDGYRFTLYIDREIRYGAHRAIQARRKKAYQGSKL